MKSILRKISALTLCVAVLTMSASAASTLTSIRANNEIDHTRVVLGITHRAPYWDVSYNDKKDQLILSLPDTVNGLKEPIDYSRNGKLLKGVAIQPGKDKALRIALVANQPVMHNIFTLDHPDRLVVDLFTNYESKTIRQLSKKTAFTTWSISIQVGRVKAFVMSNKGADNVALIDGKADKTLVYWHKTQGGRVLLPVSDDDGNQSVYGARAYLADSTKGPVILFVKPKWEASWKGSPALPITAVNGERGQDALVLYTPTYGLKTGANPYGREVVIEKGHVVALGRGDTAIPAAGLVLSGHGKMEKALAKLKVGDAITLKKVPQKLPFNPNDTIALYGQALLEKGAYVGPKRSEGDSQRVSRAFVGVTASHELLFVAIEGHTGDSVGVTLKEGATLLERLHVTDAVAVYGGSDTQLAVDGVSLVGDSPKDKTYNRVLLVN